MTAPLLDVSRKVERVAKTVYLHLGLHKTATGWLQRQFFPLLPLPLHRTRKLEKIAALAVEPGAEAIIVSHEGLGGRISDNKKPGDALRMFQATLDGVLDIPARTKVLIGFREQAAWVGSAYAQRGKKTVVTPDAYRDSYALDDLRWMRRVKLCDERGLETFLFLYEEFAHDPMALCEDLCRFLGTPVPAGTAELLRHRENPSPRSERGLRMARAAHGVARVLGALPFADAKRLRQSASAFGAQFDEDEEKIEISFEQGDAGTLHDDWQALVALISERRGRDLSAVLHEGSAVTDASKKHNQSKELGERVIGVSAAAELDDRSAKASAGTVAAFAQLAEKLDAAGLGPADYLYAPLKWRLHHQDDSDASLLASAGKAWRLIGKPPRVPRHLGQGAILAASSYPVSANFLRKVVEAFDPAEAVFCDASDAGGRSLTDRFRALLAAGPALIFALRVNRALARAGTGLVERRRITEAAFAHGVHRRAARAILREVRPECVVIANGNRPLEFALFAEAKTRGLATVLLPFAELNPKPARFLSLCRGAFDLVLPFSEHSAGEIRRLRKDAAIEVVGFPSGALASSHDDEPETSKANGRHALYVCGNNFEDEASAMLRAAFAEGAPIPLRIRLHPRSTGADIRKLFDFVPPESISNPDETPLSADLADADVAIMVRSTVALEAMHAGTPLVWLSPPEHRSEFEDHPIRKQHLALFDASTAEELRETVVKLAADAKERERVADEQWSRLCAAGYKQGYYETVKAALRRLVDWGQHPKGATPQAGTTA